MSWNRGSQGVSPKKKARRKKSAKRLAVKAVMLEKKAAKRKGKNKK